MRITTNGFKMQSHSFLRYLMFFSSDKSSRNAYLCLSVCPSVCAVKSCLELSIFISLALLSILEHSRGLSLSLYIYLCQRSYQRSYSSASIPTKSYLSEPLNTSSCSIMKFYSCQGVVLLIVALIGLTGNLVSFISIFSQKVQKTFHNLLFLLTLFDMVSLLKTIKLKVDD